MTTKSKKVLTGEEDFNGLVSAEKSLPASWYYDEAHYQSELETIFYSNWIYLCHQSLFQKPGSFQRFTIGTQQIFLVKDREGRIRGFYNSCRHRGSALCLAQQGEFSNQLIRCPYHQWAYDFSGNLRATSSHAEAADFNMADYPLLSVNVQIWRGGVFVSLSDEPESLEAGFERGSDHTDSWPMEDLVVGHRWRKIMACNWKVFWENFNECLHCPNVHPELCDLVPIYGRRISYYKDEPHWKAHLDESTPAYRGGLKAGAETWSSDGKALEITFEGLTAAEIERGQSYFVSLPSVYIAAHVDYMRTVRVLPIDAETTEVAVEWLFLPEQLDQKDLNLDNITEFGILVMSQDADASEMNQLGLRNKNFKQGVLMPEEHYVKAFQDWVRRTLGHWD